MFLKHLEPIFKPWRAVRNKIMRVRTTKGNIQSEARRVKRFGGHAGQQKKRASKLMGKASAVKASAVKAPAVKAPAVKAPAVPASMAQATPGWPAPPSNVQRPGANMTSLPAGHHQQQQQQLGPVPNPPIKIKGFWFWKRRFCTQCLARLDKTWDCCPYCAQRYAAKPPPSSRTAAFDISALQTPEGQLMGWLVAINGPHRGELFTLSPKTVIGLDSTCDIVLQNRYLSNRHAEVVARNGVWVITDLGSTNGTMVNDKPIMTHELIDNDFIGFGDCTLRFKCLYAAPPNPVVVY